MASEKLIGEEHGYLQMQPDENVPEPAAGGAGGSGESSLRQRRKSVDVRYRHERLPCADDNVDKNFFAWGRDFESVNTAHKFLSHEREKMATFEANNYYPQNSQVYRKYLADQDAKGVGKKSWDGWVAMGLIGICMGFISFFVRQTVDVIGESKYKIVESYAKDSEWAAVWAIGVGYSVGFILLSVCLVIFIEPAAASSGIPEVIAFLNGVHVPKIFNIKTLLVKFFSVICSVGSGYPVGPEGPMIHMGGMVGAGLSQGRSSTIGFETSMFDRFRNVKDRRDFITCGVACGVAAAFGSPVGGLLFAMEEVASFWSQQLGWMIFFGCMCAVFTTDIMNSAFQGYEYLGTFGSFSDKDSILYEVTYDVSMHVLALMPTVLCGVLGGVFGTMFTVFNLKVSRWRAKRIAPVRMNRILEPVAIMFIYGTLATFIPNGFNCTTVTNCTYVDEVTRLPSNNLPDDDFFYTCGSASPNGGYEHLSSEVREWSCGEKEEYVDANGITQYTIHYNDMATLLYNTGEKTIHMLFSRGTHAQFSYGALVTMLLVYFAGACCAMGTAVSAGVVVPMLLIGGCYGRIVGKICVATLSAHGGVFVEGSRWAWIDPGVFALIGAGSFFGGVSRLTLSLTVIMVEISNDIHMLLMFMVTIMCAKWIADAATHSLYHSLIELKCMPFLNDAIPSHDNMERFLVSEIMQSPVVTVPQVGLVDDIRDVFDTEHSAFPVVAEVNNKEVVVGIILKETLREILRHPDLHFPMGQNPPTHRIAYSRIQDSEVSKHHEAKHRLQHEYADVAYALIDAESRAEADRLLTKKNDGMMVDLTPYMNESVVTVLESFSIDRAYMIFRSMGLRHLIIVDKCNCPVGVLTRKDMQGHDIAHYLEHHDDHSAEGH
eukprot:m.489642 g.489642  ORF g.489642 m.489642 type:complete len:885 (-) comp21770_c0_seq1:2817-5471(-)